MEGDTMSKLFSDLETRLDLRLVEHETATRKRAEELESRIDSKLAEVLTEVRRLADTVGSMEQDKRDEEMIERGKAMAMASIKANPPAAMDSLAAWLTQWSPAQAIFVVVVIVGGATVASAVADRVLDEAFPPDIENVGESLTEEP